MPSFDEGPCLGPRLDVARVGVLRWGPEGTWGLPAGGLRRPDRVESGPLPFQIEAVGRSDVGKVRRRNEDQMAVDASQGIVVVADGMGGAPAGDVASSVAVKEVADALRVGRVMEEAIQSANRAILDRVKSDPTMAGMGTTLTALKILADSGRFVVGHVGDSRAYLLTKKGFSQISRDHTMVRDMVDAGKISAREEREHPLGHILSRALGTEARVEVDVLEGELADGDCFLLCSDGLAKVMTEEEVEVWVHRALDEPLQTVVDSVLEEANLRGAPDNVTVAFVRVQGAPGS